MAKKPYEVRKPFAVDRKTQLRIGRKVFPAGAVVWLSAKDAKAFAACLVDAPDNVEQATAAPGEKRNVTKPKAK